MAHSDSPPTPVCIRPALRLVYLYLVGFLALLVFKLIFFSDWPQFTVVWRATVVVGAALILLAYVRRMRTHYEIDHHQATAISGILVRRRVSLPLAHISNFEVHHTPLEFLVGLGDVLIDAPGGREFEIKMRELGRTDIVRVVKFLERWLPVAASAGPNPPAQPRAIG